MLILDIKQAETALNGGRLDEAFAIANLQEVRQTRRGQKLIDNLAKALIQRGTEHLESERVTEALSDCHKAEQLSGNSPDVAKLREAICRAGSNNHHGTKQKMIKLAKARDHVQQGWFSACEDLLKDEAGDGGEADLLLADVTAKRKELSIVVDKIQQALDRDDIEAAYQALIRTGRALQTNKDIADPLNKLVILTAERIRQSIHRGRLDQARHLWNLMKAVKGDSSAVKEFKLMFDSLQSAAQAMARNDMRSVSRELRRLRLELSDALWIEQAIDEAEEAAHAMESLQSGPLSWLELDKSGYSNQQSIEPDLTDQDSLDAVDPIEQGAAMDYDEAPKKVCTKSIPKRFYLQIDGIGSYLVSRDSRVTIGPISSAARPEVGLITEPGLPVVAIERTEEDYFLKPVDSAPHIQNKLLVDNERIVLSNKCHLKFFLPNAASTTALLSFSGAKYPRLDVRQVILMDREIIIGAKSNAHVSNERCTEPLVFYVQNGQLCCRSNDPIEVDGQLLTADTGLPMETTIRTGDYSFVLANV